MNTTTTPRWQELARDIEPETPALPHSTEVVVNQPEELAPASRRNGRPKVNA